jgi:hypothetical protein
MKGSICNPPINYRRNQKPIISPKIRYKCATIKEDPEKDGQPVEREE